MGSAAAVFFSSLLGLFLGVSSVLGRDLSETDALCDVDGCFVVYFQRRTFLDSWRVCKEKGGDLATVKRKEDAASIATLFSTLDLRHSRTRVKVWIGLQRQPRQCDSESPLRGFSWTTGDQDTEFTNWQREDSTSQCAVPLCVVLGYSHVEKTNNLKWLEGSCSIPADAYLCHYRPKGMCPALWSEGGGNILYDTPFDLLSTRLTHVPFGSVATVPCPAGTKEDQRVPCTLQEDGSVGWSRNTPLCSDSLASHNWCDEDNGGCEHFCRTTDASIVCECAEGYQLADNGWSCELSNACQRALCEFECLPLSDGHRCACPEGYILAPDKHGCVDEDECLQSPCEQLCENVPGSFICSCREGYHSDDQGVCEDIDECVNDPCEHACENTVGSHICHCHLGFSPVPEEPSQCQDADECQIPGTCEQMCVNYHGGFECFCEEGYELMPDHYSCQRRKEGVAQSAITSPFPWVTHRPGPAWDPEDYDWTLQKSTDWPPDQGGRPLDRLTDPSNILNSDVIWVTSAPQEDVPYYVSVDSLTEGTVKDEDIDNGGGDWLTWGQRFQGELEMFPKLIHTTLPPSPPPNTEPELYEVEEETTTTLTLAPTVPEGARDLWARVTSHEPGIPEDSVLGQNMPTDSSYHELSSVFPDKEERIHSPSTNILPNVTPTRPPADGGQNQSNTWLLVGVLVPVCILVFVMLALGIFYCTHCAQQPRDKKTTDCYHWISGAHDAQGAPDPSAGVKSHV